MVSCDTLLHVSISLYNDTLVHVANVRPVVANDTFFYVCPTVSDDTPSCVSNSL